MTPPTFTYDVTTLASDATARVRRLVGDTDVSGNEATAQFSDEEITFELTQRELDETRTAIALLRILSTKYAGAANVSSGSQRIDLTKASARYRDRADELEVELAAAESGAAADALTDIAITPVDGYSSDVATDDVESGALGWDPDAPYGDRPW